MEVIKKQVQRVMTTGTTSGDTENSFIIIPDTGTTYNFRILLTSEANDLGFFDAHVVDYPYPYPYTLDDNDNNELIGIGESLLY